ncbi:hypothetical protein ABPG77_005558 [Micractinium sp. CCAP 211/92]
MAQPAGLGLSAARTTAGVQRQEEEHEVPEWMLQEVKKAMWERLPHLFAPLRQDLQMLVHRTSPLLWSARNENGRASRPGSALIPVPHPDTGAQPPFFPATNDDLEMLSYAQLGKLLAFYDRSLAGNTLARRNRLKAFIVM